MGRGGKTWGASPFFRKIFPPQWFYFVFDLAFQFGNAELDILPALESGGLFVVKLGDALGGSVESVGIAREEAGDR